MADSNSNKRGSKECVLLKRELKRARAFEIRRLIRKIKLYSTKRGNDKQLECYKRKKERLIEEMEAMKDFELTEIANAVIHNLSSIEQLLSLKEPPNSNHTDRAKWRLLSCKCMKESLSEYQHQQTRETNVFPSGDQCASSVTSDTCEAEDGGGLSDNSSHSIVDGGGGKDTEEESVKTIDHSLRNRALCVKKSDANLAVDRDTSLGSIRRRRGRKALLLDSKKRSKLLTKDEGDSLTKRSVNSMFVGSLSTRKKKQNASKQQPKNRMGQRARRQMWERKYKERANHVTLTRKDRQPHRKVKPEQKMIRMERTSRVNHTNAKETRKFGSLFSKSLFDKTGEEDSEPLHPSWEASRLRKEQQSLTQSFQGSRIIFSDSD